MKDLNSIIIFTKDRPSTLSKTLKSLKYEKANIIVLDDSYSLISRRDNKKRSQVYPNIRYHGKAEQDILLSISKANKSQLIKFTSRLGSKQWNLGYVRNYAIILAKKLKLKKVLFLDDDIIVENSSLIRKTFDLLNHYDFAGAKIVGMIDDSVVGHIARELKLQPEEYFSGGFLAFKTSLVSEYFMNIYNEDWLWMYLHGPKYKAIRYGNAKQLFFDNFKDAIKKAKKQETGELLVDGTKKFLETGKKNNLKKLIFWKQILREKKEYYEKLKKISLYQKKKWCYKILTNVAAHSEKIKASSLNSIYISYFKQRAQWKKIINSF
jgi:hypothetical protein